MAVTINCPWHIFPRRSYSADYGNSKAQGEGFLVSPEFDEEKSLDALWMFWADLQRGKRVVLVWRGEEDGWPDWHGRCSRD